MLFCSCEIQYTSMRRQKFRVLCGIITIFILLSRNFVAVAATKSSVLLSQIENVQGLPEEGFLSESNDDQTANVWQDWLNLEHNDFTGNIKKALSNPKWWRAWQKLRTSTRDRVVSLLLPLLVPTQGWTLHCFDAYRLCQADSNCRWKYWNYISKCNSGAPLSEWDIAEQWESSAGSARSKRSKRSRQTRRSHRRLKKKSRRRLWLRSAKRRPVQYKRSWRKATKNMHYWMGKRWANIYYDPGKQRNNKCSPQCLDALLMLNKTAYGALLARCDCQIKNILNGTNAPNTKFSENACKQHQTKALECRPRLFKPRRTVIGCTEARVKCENNSTCKEAQDNFLLKCSQVINGITCTNECRAAMTTLASTSKHYNTCVCDGIEKPVCLKIRSNFEEHCTNNNGCSSIDAPRSAQNKCAKKSLSPPSNGAISKHSKLLSVLDLTVIVITFYSSLLAT